MQLTMPPATVASERRKELRKRPLSLIYVELSAANGGMMRDLSETGFAMRAMMPLRAGDTTPFAFSLNSATRLEGSSRVLWVEEEGRLAGLQFVDGNQELRNIVRDWLDGKLDQVRKPDEPVLAAGAKPPSTIEQLREELRTVPARPEIPEIEPAASSPDDSAAVGEPQGKPAETAPIVRSAEVPAVDRTLLEPAIVESSGSQAPSGQEPVLAPESNPLQSSPGPSANAPAVELPELEPLPDLPDVEFPLGSSNDAVLVDRSFLSLGVRILILCLALAFGLVFHRQLGNAMIWLGEKMGGTTAFELAPALKGDPAVPAAAGDSEPAAFPDNSGTSPKGLARGGNSSAAVKNRVENNAAPETAGSAPVKNLAATPTPEMVAVTHSGSPAPVNVPGVEAGQLEFLAAQDILKKNIDAGLPEAVRLLWASVEKGYPNAEILLAEMYHQGKGVAKNCDQTRILLTAAARKGSVEARKLLQEFQRESCE